MNELILNKVLAIMMTILSMMSGLVSSQPKNNNQMLGSTYNVTAGQTYRLQSSVGLSDSSITLSSFKEPISGIPYTMSYINSSIVYATLDPANNTNKEFISFTGITQNGDSTATLTGVSRGLGFSYPFNASTTLQRTHSGQSILILSNAPQVYNQFANRSNNDSITGLWSFTTSPYGSSPTSTSQFATKGYADALSFAGVATATESTFGGVWLGTALQAASSTDGAPNKPYVLQTKNATSSFANAVTSALKVVVTQNNGKIDPNAINGAGSYTFSGTETFTGTTILATTTTVGSSARGGFVPAGTVLNYASTTAPAGYLLCDGTSYSTATYPDLFAAIGYGYGGSGANFNVPDARGRNVLMASTTANIAQKNGESNHTMTIPELVPHTHDMIYTAGGPGATQNPGQNSSTNPNQTGSTGGGVPFNVLDPYIVMQMIIKY